MAAASAKPSSARCWPPRRYPARSPDVNVADIKAQVAANEKGVQELQRAVARVRPGDRARLHEARDGQCRGERPPRAGTPAGRRFETTIDDGTPLKVAVRVDRANRRAVIDFTGTGPQRPDNFNAPPRSAAPWCSTASAAWWGRTSRSTMAASSRSRSSCPTAPSSAPARRRAVVAGNTEVSQMTCNALLAALGACASAQATMNNVLFGDAVYQYYETVCGGTAPAPASTAPPGADAHDQHPHDGSRGPGTALPRAARGVRIRRGSGGAGQWHGGDGSRRRIRFLRPMEAVIVASRRTVAPHGLRGGSPGAPGGNGSSAPTAACRLKGSDRASLAAGEVFGLETPGGGGWGAPPGRSRRRLDPPARRCWRCVAAGGLGRAAPAGLGGAARPGGGDRERTARPPRAAGRPVRLVLLPQPMVEARVIRVGDAEGEEIGSRRARCGCASTLVR
jgi:5-oxoprolinase (ATP-hydrolysing)